MNFSKKFSVFSFLFLFNLLTLTSNLSGAAPKYTVSINKDDDIAVKVCMPVDFKLSRQDKNKTIIEYTSADETETITINRLAKTDASVFCQTLKTNVTSQASDIEVITEGIITRDHYKTACATIWYTFRGKRKLLSIHCYSGPTGCAAIQHLITLSTELDQEAALAAALEKKFSFDENNLTVGTTKK